MLLSLVRTVVKIESTLEYNWNWSTIKYQSGLDNCLIFLENFVKTGNYTLSTNQKLSNIFNCDYEEQLKICFVNLKTLQEHFQQIHNCEIYFNFNLPRKNLNVINFQKFECDSISA